MGRRPTSHERLSERPWDASYHDGPASWDVGRPQPAIVRLASEGQFAGAILDAGCGTGENALHVAALGLPVLGVDVAETALPMAREVGSSTRSTAGNGRSTWRASHRFGPDVWAASGQ